MNIFEELAESYTYNGAVSLKALDDDIVTLENQIDSYNATLNELKIRGKKVTPLVEKIRDAKIRLSLLKAFYKKESDKATSDDVILDMLGVSAKNAKEIDTVSTAADGRAPKAQNFESAELEEVVEKQPQAEVKAPENEKVVDNEVVIAEEETPETPASVLEEKDSDDEVIVVDENATEEELKELYSSLTSEDKIIVKDPEPLVKPEQEGVVDVTSASAEEEVKEQETKPVKAEKKTLANFFKKIIGKENKSTEIPDTVIPKTSDSSDTIIEGEVVPPPTIDDYLEAESGPSYEELSYDKDGVVYNYSNDQELPETEVVLSEDEESNNDPKAYDAFRDFSNKIYASFDLHEYTNIVNTNSITGCFNDKRRVIELTFADIRDYPLLSFFLEEKHKKCAFFKQFAKNAKSIIMYVQTEIDGVTKEYRYEFTGCRLIDVSDSDYKSAGESTIFATTRHEFYARFKYKDLKIS